MRLFILQAALVAAAGCSSDNDTKSVSEPDSPSPTDDTGSPPDGDDTGDLPDGIDPVDIGPDSGPCGDAGWGAVSAPEDTLHVSGDEPSHQLDPSLDADGSMTHPFRSLADLEEHLSASTELAGEAIALWPGEHILQPTSAQVLANPGLPVQSCGPETTRLKPAEAGEGPVLTLSGGAHLTLDGFSLSGRPGHPAILVEDASTLTLSNSSVSNDLSAAVILGRSGATIDLYNVEVVGGATGIWTTGGASTLTVNQSTVTDAGMAGIWTTGGASTLTDVVVKDTVGIPGISDTRGGWGVVLKDGIVALDKVHIKNVQQGGLVLNNTAGAITDLRVEDVSTNADGELGRGIHAWNSYDPDIGLTLTNIEVENVHDVGILARNTHPLTLTNISVINVEPATYVVGVDGGDSEGLDSTTDPSATITTGDGLIVVQRGWVDTADPENNCIELTGDNVFRGITRAGIITDASALYLEAPTILEAGETFGSTGISLFSQHSATIDWIGDAPPEWTDETTGTYPAPSTIPFAFHEEDVGMSEDDG